MAQQLAQRDAALEAFDELRVQKVVARGSDTASTFLARFQFTAASLGPNERIKLVVTWVHLELLKAVLSDPQADKICSLFWWHSGKEDVTSVIPLLTNNCPELTSLEIKGLVGFDVVSSVLEHPSIKIKVLAIPLNSKRDLPRFFAALEQSQVSAFTLVSDGTPEFELGMGEYLAKDLLVRLKMTTYEEVPSELILSLANCTHLAELEMFECIFFEPTALAHLPKSVSKLVLFDCRFADEFDWSFLANVQELNLHGVRGVFGSQLGSALAVHLRATGMDKLRIFNCEVTDEILAELGVELGRIKRLDIENYLEDTSIALIALALQSPNSELQELVLPYNGDTAESIENRLVPALKHPNCSLNKLSLLPFEDEHEVLDRFRSRRALFALLQGQQVRRLYCPLQRLPVEMFRMVGMVLL